MNTLPDKITISLNDDEKVSVKGFIAPIEYTRHYNDLIVGHS